MVNEAHFCVTGYVATQPKRGFTKDGQQWVSMRVGWTPRMLDRSTGEWADQPSSFISVQCYRKVAEHAAVCLRRGDPIVLKGTLRVREYADQSGAKRTSVDVVADAIGHDLSRGITLFSRTPAQAEQTALEYERALTAAGRRGPLPGDRPDPEQGDGVAAQPADQVDLEPADESEILDDDQVSELLAGEAGDPDAVEVPA